MPEQDLKTLSQDTLEWFREMVADPAWPDDELMTRYLLAKIDAELERRAAQ